MHRIVVSALVAVLVSSASSALIRPAAAQQEAPLQIAPGCDADALLCATIQRLVEALGQALEAVPRYAPPETDSHGNIILRRLNPPAPSVNPDEPPSGWTLDRTSA